MAHMNAKENYTTTHITGNNQHSFVKPQHNAISVGVDIDQTTPGKPTTSTPETQPHLSLLHTGHATHVEVTDHSPRHHHPPVTIRG